MSRDSFMRGLADGLIKGPYAKGKTFFDNKDVKVKCSYCGTIYWVSPTSKRASKCENCSAPLEEL